MYQFVSEHKNLELELSRIPKHVAIIMDGNRRWAKEQGLSPMVGHWKGAEVLCAIVESAAALGIKVLTVYAFSTENWNRNSEEIDALMKLFEMYLRSQKDHMLASGVKLDVIGDVEKLPLSVKETIKEVKDATVGGSRIELVLALNYGSRDDIRRAVVAILEDVEKGFLKKEDVTEKLIASHLDTAKWDDPELLIRTSGEKRLSNFLLWQISYAEVHYTDVLWPDFDEKELMSAILEFQKRDRRIGG
jgi:undecaprenyl diphosphate synthase